jgi:hypothetical protein
VRVAARCSVRCHRAPARLRFRNPRNPKSQSANCNRYLRVLLAAIGATEPACKAHPHPRSIWEPAKPGKMIGRRVLTKRPVLIHPYKCLCWGKITHRRVTNFQTVVVTKFVETPLSRARFHRDGTSGMLARCRKLASGPRRSSAVRSCKGSGAARHLCRCRFVSGICVAHSNCDIGARPRPPRRRGRRHR